MNHWEEIWTMKWPWRRKFANRVAEPRREGATKNGRYHAYLLLWGGEK